MAEYIALLHKERHSNYGANFPDFPGAITAASTLEELRGMAEEMLAFHMEGLIEDGEPIPDPTPLDGITEHPDHRDAVAVLAVQAPATSSVRINITVPEAMLKRIDRYAAKHGLTRSGFLVRAARHDMDGEAVTRSG